MLIITPSFSLPLAEIEITAIRAQGAGGQHVQKTSSAVHLRFPVASSSLPEDCKPRLLAAAGQRASKEGEILIKAQQFRSQEQNRAAALERLRRLIEKALTPPRLRKAIKPSASARRKRTDAKTRRGAVKVLRGKPADAG